MKTNIELRHQILQSIYEKPQTFSELLNKHFANNDNKKSTLHYILQSMPIIIKQEDNKWHIHDSFDETQTRTQITKLEKQTKIYIKNNPQLPPTEKAKHTLSYLEKLHSQIILYTNSYNKAKHQKKYFNLRNPEKRIKKLVEITLKYRNYYDDKIADIYGFAQKENYYGELLDYFLIHLRAGYLFVQAL